MGLDTLISKINSVSKNIIFENRTRLMKLENSHVLKNPDEITKSKREIILRNIEKLEILNPLVTLKRGYTLAKTNGKVVSSAKDVKSGDELDIEFDDGTVNTKVI
jgi:exodeoxyribonuclease VII large subunit